MIRYQEPATTPTTPASWCARSFRRMRRSRGSFFYESCDARGAPPLSRSFGHGLRVHVGARFGGGVEVATAARSRRARPPRRRRMSRRSSARRRSRRSRRRSARSANTVAVAERSGRNTADDDGERRREAARGGGPNATPEAYGVDADFRAFLAALAPETLDAVAHHARRADPGRGVIPAGDARAPRARGRARAREPPLRARPEVMTDDRFWAAYFAHTSSRPRVREAARELEDAGAARGTAPKGASARARTDAEGRGAEQVELVPLSVGPAEAAAALAAEYADLDVSSDETDAEDETDANADGGGHTAGEGPEPFEDAAEEKKRLPRGRPAAGTSRRTSRICSRAGARTRRRRRRRRSRTSATISRASSGGKATTATRTESRGRGRGGEREGPETWEKVEPPPNV